MWHQGYWVVLCACHFDWAAIHCSQLRLKMEMARVRLSVEKSECDKE